MPDRIIFYPGRGPALDTVLDPARGLLIGRGADCDLTLPDDRLSRHHARLEHGDDGWRITDLKSKNGTAVAGHLIARTTSLTSPVWLSLGGVLARLETLDEKAWEALQRARAARRHTTREALRTLDPALATESLLEQILASVLQVSNTRRGLIMLAREDGELETVVQHELPATQLDSPAFSGSASAIADAVRERRIVLSANALTDPQLCDRPSVATGAIHALACLPLLHDDRLLGVVYADSQEPGHAFDTLDLELLEGLADQAALALGASRLRQQLKKIRGELGRTSAPQTLTGLLAAHARDRAGEQ